MDSKEKIEFCRTKMQELVSILFLIIMPLILALKLFLLFLVVGLWWQGVQNRFKPWIYSYPLDECLTVEELNYKKEEERKEGRKLEKGRGVWFGDFYPMF